jgi:hypothetical protein
MQVNYYNQAYDYGSVMHYDGYGFAVDPSLPTIHTTDAAYQSTIGQRITPSFVDFAQVRLAAPSFTLVCRSMQPTARTRAYRWPMHR